jgi:hypothetical protein
MELDTLTPDMPALLMELGISYDPDKLAAVLNKRWPQVYARAAQVGCVRACMCGPRSLVCRRAQACLHLAAMYTCGLFHITSPLVCVCGGGAAHMRMHACARAHERAHTHMHTHTCAHTHVCTHISSV